MPVCRPTSAEQHRWIDDVGTRADLSINKLRELCLSASVRLAEARRFYFIVHLQPDGIDPNSYLMSVWLQQHLSVEEPLHRDDTPITLAEVEGLLPELLGQAHATLGVGAGELTLEFILPRSLIGHPIDQWQVDRVFPHRLGTSYPVVVRSLDRLGSRGLHGTWRSKWRWLADNGHREGPEAIYWLPGPWPKAPEALRASLLRDDSLVELPTQVLQLRQKADELEETASILGRHLTLLWDDADRIPQSFSRTKRLRAPR